MSEAHLSRWIFQQFVRGNVLRFILLWRVARRPNVVWAARAGILREQDRAPFKVQLATFSYSDNQEQR